MTLAVGILIVVAAVSVAVGAILLVRRRAPEGSYFSDGDRASGVFGVLATGFSIFAGFVIFLAFTSYDQSRSGAEAEALAVVQQYETAQFLPASCASAVPRRARPATDGTSSTRSGHGWRTAPWATRSARGRSPSSGAFETVEPDTPGEESAYDKWLDQTSDPRGGAPRSPARRRRDHPDLDLDRPVPRPQRSSSRSCSSSPTAPSWRGRRRCSSARRPPSSP